VEAFLDYEVGGDSPVQAKASEAGVRADLGEAFHRDAVNQRLKIHSCADVVSSRRERLHARAAAAVSRCARGGSANSHTSGRGHKFAGTTHYTIVLGERGASRIADLISELASRPRAGMTA